MQNVGFLPTRTVSKEQRRQTKTPTHRLSYQELNKEKTMSRTLLATSGFIAFTHRENAPLLGCADNERNTGRLRGIWRDEMRCHVHSVKAKC